MISFQWLRFFIAVSKFVPAPLVYFSVILCRVVDGRQRLQLMLKARGIRDGIIDWTEQWLTVRTNQIKSKFCDGAVKTAGKCHQAFNM